VTKIQKTRFAKEVDLDPPWVRIDDFAKMRLRRPLVLVNGAFDILHTGHMKILHHAHKHGKTVVVALDSDAFVGRKKPGRPFLTWVERAVQFRFMPVDFIVSIESDKEFVRLVEVLKPDLRVRGAEYKELPSRIPQIPSLYVHDTGMHSTKLIERIKNAR